MDIHSRITVNGIALGVLSLVCLAPPFASSKIPAGFPACRGVQDVIQVPSSTRALGRNSQAGKQQDANSQPQILTTERRASKPPQITYEDGQLTIVTENSPLSEVMTALRAAMGADIDLPASVADQRIWIRLGPGPARGVLRDLLDSTELDYVIQASDTDEQGIRSVLLTLRSKTDEQGVPGSREARGTSRKILGVSSSLVEAPQESSTPAASATVPDTAPSGSPSPSTGAESAASRVQAVRGASDPSLSRPGAGSSEQMIQQLQSLYEQRRQQMQQNQKPPGTN